MSNRAVALAIALLGVTACEPIESPARDDTGLPPPATASSELPRVTLRDRSGNVVAVPSPAAAATIVTVMDPAIADAARYLSRVDAAVSRLGDDQRLVARFLVHSGTVPDEAWRPVPGWVSLRGPAEGVVTLGAAVGVVWWRDADGPAQTFGVAVLDPEGEVQRRFGGLQTWDELELTAVLARLLAAAR